MNLTQWRLRLIVSSLFTVSLLSALDHTIVATSLVTIAGEWGAVASMSWIVVGYTLTSTVLIPVLGRLGDRIGARRVLIFSLVLFLLASAACGAASSLEALIVFRCLQGIGGAGLQLMGQAIVAAVTVPRDRPRYLALVGSAFPVAILAGPLLGGMITDLWGWRWVFWINLPIGAAALLLALVAIPRLEPTDTGRIGAPGALLFMAAAVGLVLACTWMLDPQLRAAAIVAGALSVLAWVAFAVHQRSSCLPLMPYGQLRRRAVLIPLLLAATIGLGLFSIVNYIPTYVQMTQGVPATVAGVVPIAAVFGQLISTLLTGWLVSRTGKYRAYPAIGCALSAAAFVALAVVPAPVPLWWPALCFGVVGLGTGAFMNLIVAAAQSGAGPAHLGGVTAAVNLARMLCATLGTSVVGALIGLGVAVRLGERAAWAPEAVRAAGDPVQAQVAAAYHDVLAPVFLCFAGVYVVGLALALALPSAPLSDGSARPDAAAEPGPDAAPEPGADSELDPAPGSGPATAVHPEPDPAADPQDTPNQPSSAAQSAPTM